MTTEAEESRKTPDENVQWDVCIMSFFLGQSGIRVSVYSFASGGSSIDFVILVLKKHLNFVVKLNNKLKKALKQPLESTCHPATPSCLSTI